MAVLGSILIADDEETYRNSTVYLLQQRGFACDGAADGEKALRLMRENRYDLLIADIRMPGNDDLELIHSAQEVTGGIPVILVTGYPSVETAARSVPLPVVAYMTKPVDFDELCANVEAVMDRSHTKHLATKTLEAMEASVRDLREVIHALGGPSKLEGRARLAENLDAAMMRLAECYQAVHGLHASLTRGGAVTDPCRVLKCSGLECLEAAVRDSIAVIEQTKNSFKSKELGGLRRRLREVLAR